MDAHTDDELVHQAKSGNLNAMEHLFEKHYLFVYRLAYKWCGIKENAEDITQEVFLKLVRKLDSFSHKSSFKTWLYRITINAAKDYGRKNARKSSHEFTYDDNQPQDNFKTQEDELSARQMYKMIHQLPKKQKESILLVFAEGLSHRAAAEILQCRETTVSWRIFQARKKLKILLADKSK